MKLIIEINDSLFQKAAESAFAEQFAHQRYGKAFGTEIIEKQVQEFVRKMDFSTYIQEAAKAKLDDVVNQVVEHALRDAAKKKAKQMQADGSLFT